MSTMHEELKDIQRELVDVGDDFADAVTASVLNTNDTHMIISRVERAERKLNRLSKRLKELLESVDADAKD